MPSIRAPATKQTTTLTVSSFFFPSFWVCKVHSFTVLFWKLDACILLQVAVKCRPFRERERGRDIVRVIDNKVCGGGSELFLTYKFFSICGVWTVYWFDVWNFNCRRCLCWILICQRTTLSAYRIEQRKRNIVLIMHLILAVLIWYVESLNLLVSLIMLFYFSRFIPVYLSAWK